MAELKENGTEPVLAVRVTKIIWILVFTTAFLAWAVLRFEDHITGLVQQEIQAMADKVDHEMDDVSDNYNEAIDMVIAGKCSDALKVFKASHICQRR